MLIAEAWVQWHDEAIGRATILARRALQLDATNADAMTLLGMIDELQRRDPSERLRAAITASPPSIEAFGRLALVGDVDAERCAWARRYLRAAPDGSIATAVRERVATCPAAP